MYNLNHISQEFNYTNSLFELNNSNYYTLTELKFHFNEQGTKLNNLIKPYLNNWDLIVRYSGKTKQYWNGKALYDTILDENPLFAIYQNKGNFKK